MWKTRQHKHVIRTIALIVIAIVLIRICFWPTRVNGHSMEPSLYHNDVVVISKLPTWFGEVTYDDFVVVEVENVEGLTERVVKRVIAMSGDHVVIEDDTVSINGNILIEDYRQGVMMDDLDYYVPAGAYFILGDNRSVSRDSRIFGCVDEGKIIELVLFKLF